MQTRFAEQTRSVSQRIGRTSRFAAMSEATINANLPSWHVRAVAQHVFTPAASPQLWVVGDDAMDRSANHRHWPQTRPLSPSEHPRRMPKGSTRNINLARPVSRLARAFLRPFAMQTQNFNEPVFYMPAKGSTCPEVIDLGNYNNDGEIIGLYSQESLTQLRGRYPDLQVGELNEVIKLKERMLCTPPKAITQSQYLEMLNALPPEGFKVNAEGESFKMSERFSGRITDIFGRVGRNYYTFKDVFTLPHHEIIRRLRQHEANQRAKQTTEVQE